MQASPQASTVMSMSNECSPKRSSLRASLYKGRSPNWKSSLKDKCRLEMKVRRQSVLNRMRSMDINDESLINDILHSQFISLSKELGFVDEDILERSDEIHTLMEEIKQELLIEQASDDMAMGEALFDEMVNTQFEESIICPICQRNNLFKLNHKIVCNCGIELYGQSNLILSQIGESLRVAVDLHSNSCNQIPLFSVEADQHLSVLSMQCNFCKFVYRIP